jgi:predicted TIM-barrel fold metal-dependent hydrolase
MKIFDSHMHLGEGLSGKVISEEQQLEICQRYGIEGGIVLPFCKNPDYKLAHDRIAGFCAKNQTFFGVICVNPIDLSSEAIIKEMERCVKDLNFIAVKLHPATFGVFPTSNEAGIIFETASRLGISVIVHTGWGLPFASPSLLIPRAKQYPNLPIILAHAGYGAATGAEAIVAAQTCDNIYLETSWCWGMDILNMVSQVGAERVMMGTDMPENVGAVLAIYEAINLTNAEREACFWKTAKSVFNLPL